MSLEQELIDASDSVLIVIDVQDHFLTPKLGEKLSRLLLNRIGWLMDSASKLDAAPLRHEQRDHLRHPPY